MRQFMRFAVLGVTAAAVGACSSTPKDGDREPSGIPGVGAVAGFKPAAPGRDGNPLVQKANFFVRQAAGNVLNFRKTEGEYKGKKQDLVLIETCELAAENDHCNADDSKTITIPASVFTNRLRMLLQMGPYERIPVGGGLTVSVADANKGRDPSLLVRTQIELDKVDQLRRTLKRLEDSQLMKDAATVDQKQIDDLKQSLSKIDKSSSENIRVRQAAEKVDAFVDTLVNRIFEKGKTYELINGKDHERLEWALLHSLIQVPELSTDFKNIPVDGPAGSYRVLRLKAAGQAPSQRDRDRDRDERGKDNRPSAKITEVRITKPYEIGVTEVTQFDYVRLMGDNPSVHKTAKDCKVQKFDGIDLCPNNPVDSVTKAQIDEFIRTINEADRVYRYSLPTEAQWELAARAGGTSAYAFGDLGTPAQGVGGLLGQANITREDRIGAAKYAWTADSWVGEDVASENKKIAELRASGIDYKNTTMSVGLLVRNGNGLADVHGNVAEWVLASFGEKESGAGKEKKKLCADNEANVCYVDPCSACGEKDPLTIAKGGSYMTSLEQARLDLSPKTIAGPDVGFRLVRVRK